MRYGMVIDLKKCVGCNACTVACKQENATPTGIYWSKVLQYEVGSYPDARLRFLPMLCMHCRQAPCLEACPTGATYRREDGPVLVDDDRCIGCRYCIMACPYEARSYNGVNPQGYFPSQGLTPYEEQGYQQHPCGSVQKCSFCAHRLDQGKEPACVATCPAEARIFGDLDDPGSKVARLVASGRAKARMAEQGTEPSVFYVELE
ncbi:MAG: sulfate reduction electron transfer complex DsrMKJOP subunit DsrO [Chloroflexota bacterium]